MLRRNIISVLERAPMMSAVLPRYPLFDLYAESLNAAERATRFWSEVYRTSTDFAFWWADRWLELPSTIASFQPAFSPGLQEAAVEAAEAAIVTAAAPAVVAATTLPEASEPEAPAAMAEAEPVPMAETAPEPAAAQTVADDLTRIVGIGPRLATLLAERGITSFAQIADWTDAEASEIDREMDLKGRIARNGWVIQAQRLADES